jgi:WD40 repeat protein
MEVKATPAVLNSAFNINAVPTVISDVTLSTLHTIQPANDIFSSGVDITDTYAVVGAVGSNVLSVYSPLDGQLLRTIPRPNTDFSRLGFVVSIQGNTVTASHDYVDGGNGKPVYQFNLTNGNLIRTIPSPDAITFGLSMDTSPLYTIVGTGTGTGNNAYIYENSTGNLLHTLSVSGKKLRSCTINDNYAVVSAFDGTACYVYNPSNGNLLFTINHPSFNSSDADQFGQVIILRGRYLAVSAPNRDFGTTTDGLDSGVVYLFDMETNGTLLRTFLNPNVGGTRRNDRFGQAVSIQGNYMMVGAFQEDVEGTFLENKNRGAVYTYNLLTGNLMQTLVGTNDFQGFGWKLALSENYAAVNDQLPVGNGNTAFRIYTVT